MNGGRKGVTGLRGYEVRKILITHLTANSVTPNTSPPAPEAPPTLRRWRTLYFLLVGELAALVLLFYALTRWAS
jgi:hypothetical protein